MARMREDDLKSILSAEITRALGYTGAGGTVAKDREKALDYYYGRPFGNEIEGRSSVVSTDVADVIESIMPSLMKIFAATDDVAKFDPRGREDEQAAQQATDYVNFLFYSDNPGFLILHDWFKDALLQKLGAVKAWWEVEEVVSEETLTGLTDPEVAQILGDEEIEPIEHTATPIQIEVAPGQPPQIVTVHDLKIKRTAKNGRLRVMGIPPEELLLTPGSRSRDMARLIGHRTLTTRTRLIEQGYPRDVVMSIPAGDDMANSGHATRMEDEGGAYPQGSAAGDQASENVFINECYIEVDAELRRIVSAGPSEADVILDNDPAPERQIYLLSPVRVPHKVIGQSVADLVMDLQLIKSTLQRQFLDNAYLVNAPRLGVTDGQVNLDDLLNPKPGGVIRMKPGASITPITVPPMLAPALQGLEYFDSVREVRTGITRYNQGLDANSLNKTATGVNAIMGAAQQRLELIARIFAETGVRDLFRGILRLVVRHQDKQRVIRLRGQWIPVDPRSWNADMDMSVAVGLGTGNKDQMLAHVLTLLQVQEKAAMASGGTMVSPQNFFQSFTDLVNAIGLKGVEKYFTDPAKAGPQPPKEDPEMAKIKAQIAGDQAKAQNDMVLQREKMANDITLEREKMQMDFALKREELMLKAQSGAFMPQPVVASEGAAV